jgi:signal transduction histidine kinase
MRTLDHQIRVLLIEDDEDDYILVRDLLADIVNSSYLLDWETAYESGLVEICRNRHDVYLLDYRLGQRTGLDLLREAMEKGCLAPIIFLTGQGDYEVDREAMAFGAADFLAKKEMTSSLLERSIRYAIEQRRIQNSLRASESQVRLLSSQLLAALEIERRNIAREIHDDIGGALAAFKFKLEHVLGQWGDVSPQVTDSLKGLIPLIQNTIEGTRRIQSHLRPSILDDFGILSTITWFCRQFVSTYSAIGIKQEIALEEDEISDDLKTIIFRILQEAMNNIAKHSQANEVLISLKNEDQEIEFTVQDNGIGFKMEEALQRRNPCRGLGLDSMRERTELSGGTFIIESSDSGTVIRARWSL